MPSNTWNIDVVRRARQSPAADELRCESWRGVSSGRPSRHRLAHHDPHRASGLRAAAEALWRQESSQYPRHLNSWRPELPSHARHAERIRRLGSSRAQLRTGRRPCVRSSGAPSTLASQPQQRRLEIIRDAVERILGDRANRRCSTSVVNRGMPRSHIAPTCSTNQPRRPSSFGQRSSEIERNSAVGFDTPPSAARLRRGQTWRPGGIYHGSPGRRRTLSRRLLRGSGTHVAAIQDTGAASAAVEHGRCRRPSGRSWPVRTPYRRQV